LQASDGGDTHVLPNTMGGAHQDGGIKLAREAYVQTVKCRNSGRGKKASERRALTLCRTQRKGHSRQRTEVSERWHSQSVERRGTSQNRERKPVMEGHAHPVERRKRDKSGQQDKVSERGALTSCHSQPKGHFKTEKVNQQARALTLCWAQTVGQISTKVSSQRVSGTH
jgi:hypothetical protein